MTARGRSLTGVRPGIVGAVLVTLLAACANGAAAPDGWTNVELDGLTFAQPPGLEARPSTLTEAFWAYGAADSEDLTEATTIVRATGLLGDDEFSHAGVSRLLANYRHALPGFDVVSEEDVEIDGASSASRVRYRYEADDGREIQGVWIVASDLAERRSAAVDVAGRNLDDEMVRELESTVRMRPREDGPEDSVTTEG